MHKVSRAHVQSLQIHGLRECKNNNIAIDMLMTIYHRIVQFDTNVTVFVFVFVIYSIIIIVMHTMKEMFGL